MIKDLEQELAEKLSNEMAKEIDWELMVAMMISVGWIKVSIPNSWSDMTASFSREIKEWCKENVKGHYNNRGRVWLFEKEQDAEWFMLRWS
jgi:hypothetical protein